VAIPSGRPPDERFAMRRGEGLPGIGADSYRFQVVSFRAHLFLVGSSDQL
jgi:hypothetical protein